MIWFVRVQIDSVLIDVVLVSPILYRRISLLIVIISGNRQREWDKDRKREKALFDFRVVVRLGSTVPFSQELNELQEEVKPLWKMPSCPRDFKRTSVEILFREAEFRLDWCSFRLVSRSIERTAAAVLRETLLRRFAWEWMFCTRMFVVSRDSNARDYRFYDSFVVLRLAFLKNLRNRDTTYRHWLSLAVTFSLIS